MIRRNTWLLLLILLALVGFSFFTRNRNARNLANATPTVGPIPLLLSGEGAPDKIRLESSSGPVVDLSRDQTGTWVLNAPTQEAADQAAAEAAATQVGALQVLSSVDLGPEIIGLDAPAYTLTVTFASGSVHTLDIGSITPIQDGYYARLDGGASTVVDRSGIEALIGMLDDPPYAATRTPTAEPATSTLEAPAAASPSPRAEGATATP